ncbi:MAG: hypothetical protein JW874_02215 [Spirochaetales bacterium]|nr:hypothetical protein [Spirochaetales bacterium]
MLYDAGAFIPLNDLLNQYGQDILKLWRKNVYGADFWGIFLSPYGDSRMPDGKNSTNPDPKRALYSVQL